MKTKLSKPPTDLLLTDITLDPNLCVRPVDESVAKDYAEHLFALPPLTVWELDGKYLLVNGWHRYRAHQLANAARIKVIIMSGTLEQAKFFVANTDTRIGLRRTRAAKRAAVVLVLGTETGAGWGDREIGRHCDVSHTFVAMIREELATKGAPAAERESGNVAADVPGRAANVSMDEADLKEGSVGTGTMAAQNKRGARGRRVVGSKEGHEHALREPSEVLAGDAARAGPLKTEMLALDNIVTAVRDLVAGCASNEMIEEVLDHLVELLSGMRAGARKRS